MTTFRFGKQDFETVSELLRMTASVISADYTFESVVLIDTEDYRLIEFLDILDQSLNKTGENPALEVCSLCGKSFKNLKQHIRRMHQEKIQEEDKE